MLKCKTRKGGIMERLGRSCNPNAGWVPFEDACQILASGTHDLTGDFMEPDLGYSEVDLCGRRALGDMTIVDHPDGWVRRSYLESFRSEDIEGTIHPDWVDE